MYTNQLLLILSTLQISQQKGGQMGLAGFDLVTGRKLTRLWPYIISVCMYLSSNNMTESGEYY